LGGERRSIQAVINPAAGRAGPQAAAEMADVFEDLGLTASIAAPEPAKLDEALKHALRQKPDLLVILAGDGTARAAAQLCGHRGPLVAPLPGGTMNMLPKALYGDADWKSALKALLTDGEERMVGGGEIAGHTFYCAAMLGSTALFAPAREAARHGELRMAFDKASAAYRRAFASKLGFVLEDGVEHRAMAVTLLCPMISKALDDEDLSMEVAALHPTTAGEAARLGARVIMSRLIGDWRNDSTVEVGRTRKGRIWSRGPIPALLDGESVRLGRNAAFKFHPKAFRALTPASEAEIEL